MAELVVENVSKSYPMADRVIEVLRDISIRLSVNESVAIVGPSGSGKSTLLGILGTLETPSAGRVMLGEQDPASLSEPMLAAFRRQRIGFVFQDHFLLPQLSALENVLVPTLAAGRPSRETVDRGRQLLERVGLAERMDHRPAELSGGERQRVAIARALVEQPSVLLADEPTGNLDQTTSDEIADLLAELRAQRPMIQVVVTHSQRIAGKMDRRMMLDDGRLTPMAS